MPVKDRSKYYLEHREEILAKGKLRHCLDWNFKAYRELTNLRKKYCRMRDSIIDSSKKLAHRRAKLKAIKYRIEELELEWGHLRAIRKAKNDKG